jgi:hypothetical protein
MMLAQVGDFQISEAVPVDGGGLRTTLVDQNGNNVGTVTRLADGTATASVDDRGGFDWGGVLTKVTGFLDEVAKATRATSDEATRISRGIQGAATGAQAGYRAPIDWKPWAVAGGVVLVSVVVAVAASSKKRR